MEDHSAVRYVFLRASTSRVRDESVHKFQEDWSGTGPIVTFNHKEKETHFESHIRLKN